MRRILLVAVLAWCGGYLMAAGAALGYMKLKTWREFGERFQLGYVVGYLDAVKLSKMKDSRVWGIPTFGKFDYDDWHAKVNAFYADPANAGRSVPDAMGSIGKKLQEEMFKNWRERADQPGPGAGAAPGAGDSGGAPSAEEPAVAPGNGKGSTPPAAADPLGKTGGAGAAGAPADAALPAQP